jgi:hypothetical protein
VLARLGYRLPIGWCYWGYPIVPISPCHGLGLLAHIPKAQEDPRAPPRGEGGGANTGSRSNPNHLRRFFFPCPCLGGGLLHKQGGPVGAPLPHSHNALVETSCSVCVPLQEGQVGVVGAVGGPGVPPSQHRGPTSVQLVASSLVWLQRRCELILSCWPAAGPPAAATVPNQHPGVS